MSKRVRVSSYRHAGGSRAHFYASRQAAAGEGTHGGFAALMVLLPLATFAAVFLWNGPPLDFAVLKGDPGPSDAELQHLYSASETELARERWPTTPAMLDGAQPHFPICEGGDRANCVVDGDTFWYRGEKIRISDINTPEVSEPDCPREAALGARATRRLQDLLNQGAFSPGFDPSGRDTDRYGRKLRTVNRDGESLGGKQWMKASPNTGKAAARAGARGPTAPRRPPLPRQARCSGRYPECAR